MNTSDLLSDIMGMLTMISEDKEKLMKVLSFIEKEVLDRHENTGESGIMDQYSSAIDQIASGMDSGIVCYLNPDTMEMEQVFSDTIFDIEEYEEQHDDKMDDFDMNYVKWDSYIKFEPLSRNEEYRIMERYIFQLDDEELASKLETSLSQDNPLTNFKSVVGDSDHRQDWIDFNKKAVTEIVKNKLLEGLQHTEQGDSI